MKSAASAAADLYHSVVDDVFSFAYTEFPRAGEGKAGEELYRRWCQRLIESGVLSHKQDSSSLAPPKSSNTNIVCLLFLC